MESEEEIFEDSVVELCRLRNVGDIYPSTMTPPLTYPMFSLTKPASFVEGSPRVTSLLPASTQNLGDTSGMLVLSSIIRTFPLVGVREMTSLRYVLISDRGSDWIKFIQFLDPSSHGFVSANREGVDFDYSKLAIKSNYLNPFYGEDSSGNLNKNYKDFITFIVSLSGRSRLVVYSDCSRTSPYIVLKIAIAVLENSGSLVMRIDNVDDTLVYIVSLLFRKVALFRPLLQDVYVIATGFRYNEQAVRVVESSKKYVTLDSQYTYWIERSTKNMNNIRDVELDYLTARLILDV